MSEPNYHTINFFSEYLLAIEMKKQTNKQTKQNKKHTHKLMNKTVWIDPAILEIRKIALYQF